MRTLEVAPDTSLQLPLQVTSPVDVGRLLRELDSIDSLLSQAALRPAATEVKLPKTTGLLDQAVELNKLNLSEAGHREKLLVFLRSVKDKAPLLHVSFSADPSTQFIERLMTWLRKEIDPTLMLTVGLQPNIGAGCIVRSTNKHFDFSLRQDFAKKRNLLLEKIDPEFFASAATEPPVTPATTTSVTVAVESAEIARTAAPGAKDVHSAPQPTAKLMTATPVRPGQAS
ncbi:MAG: hypothetical protein ABIV43_01830 [Candidatus Saccharimonadales bacterium]